MAQIEQWRKAARSGRRVMAEPLTADDDAATRWRGGNGLPRRSNSTGGSRSVDLQISHRASERPMDGCRFFVCQSGVRLRRLHLTVCHRAVRLVAYRYRWHAPPHSARPSSSRNRPGQLMRCRKRRHPHRDCIPGAGSSTQSPCWSRWVSRRRTVMNLVKRLGPCATSRWRAYPAELCCRSQPASAVARSCVPLARPWCYLRSLRQAFTRGRSMTSLQRKLASGWSPIALT